MASLYDDLSQQVNKLVLELHFDKTFSFRISDDVETDDYVWNWLNDTQDFSAKDFSYQKKKAISYFHNQICPVFNVFKALIAGNIYNGISSHEN